MFLEVTEELLSSAAEIHSKSWKESHRSFCEETFVEAHTIESQTEYLRKEKIAGKRLYLLKDVHPVGIVSIDGNMIENLYVLPEKQGKGYGKQLIEFALSQCEGVPTLWILENNTRAYHLYSKYGFVLTGEKHELSKELSEVEMKCLNRI